MQYYGRSFYCFTIFSLRMFWARETKGHIDSNLSLDACCSCVDLQRLFITWISTLPQHITSAERIYKKISNAFAAKKFYFLRQQPKQYHKNDAERFFLSIKCEHKIEHVVTTNGTFQIHFSSGLSNFVVSIIWSTLLSMTQTCWSSFSVKTRRVETNMKTYEKVKRYRQINIDSAVYLVKSNIFSA